MGSPITNRVMQQPRLSSTACERCYKYKERCTYEESHDACSRCRAVSARCRPRLKKRMGRRPQIRALPHGAFSVMHFAEEHQSKETRLITCPPASFDKLKHTRRLEGVTWYSSSLVPCNDAVSEDASHHFPNLHSLPPPLHSYSEVHQLLGSTQIFFKFHSTFVLGTSFVKQFHFTVRRLFDRASRVLIDAYSVATKLLKSRHEPTRVLEDDDLAIESHCLQRLMDGAPSITHPEDAAVVLLLGQALLVYNNLISSPATHVITRGTLLSVRGWYPAMLDRPYLDDITLTPVLMDTVECIVRREMPVLQIPVLGRCVVDRFLGLRCSLLPLLYRLCERSYEARSDILTDSPGETTSVQGDRYSEIEQLIRDWAPQCPTDFFSTYSALEANIMFVQARSYRLAALLIVHRLRFPLGVQDLVAQMYAMEILEELSILKTWPPGAPTGLGLDFPLLVATLEIPEQGADLYQVAESLRFRRPHSSKILNFVGHVMRARRDGFRGLWFDLVHDHLHGLILT